MFVNECFSVVGHIALLSREGFDRRIFNLMERLK